MKKEYKNIYERFVNETGQGLRFTSWLRHYKETKKKKDKCCRCGKEVNWKGYPICKDCWRAGYEFEKEKHK